MGTNPRDFNPAMTIEALKCENISLISSLKTEDGKPAFWGIESLTKWSGLQGESEDDIHIPMDFDEERLHRIARPMGSDNPNVDIYSDQSPTHCPYHYDGVLCWPPTIIGEMADLPCMEDLNGVRYNTSGIVTRVCNMNGIWDKTNYTSCKHMFPPIHVESLNTTITIYLYGFSLSLVALLFAAIIFTAFKELRCLRNTIHSHLMLTYILHDAVWMICLTSIVFSDARSLKHSHHAACIQFILLHYFYLTNFFWMFVEGLYLYVLVVQTFMTETIKLRTYCLVGWGIPFLVVKVWCVIRWHLRESQDDLDYTASLEGSSKDTDQTLVYCPWLDESIYDWIHKVPALLCLGANMLFLLRIMWVLITKLRSATTPETQQSRKAAKALVVLMPLLGITYILFLIGPRNNVPLYDHVREFLISTQGFLVALFYCFLNQEVRLALRHRWGRFRTLGQACNCFSCEGDLEQRNSIQQNRDWSPRSRTESLRLYTPTGQNSSKRESSASETTTMTAVFGSFNGSGAQQNIMMTSIPNRRHSSSATPIHSIKFSNLMSNDDAAFV